VHPLTNTIQLRDRRQLTLPADIVREANLQVNDMLEVTLTHGVIQLVPTSRRAAGRHNMERYLGATRGLYGETAADANDHVRHERDSW
jgi:bifunctional DNA-binding transcriptional regulator/antitoxin component of YhaV-PrlF toxin-antitoxin module